MKNRCERVDLQMEIQNKEEINFHNFMKMIREKKGISLQTLSEGLCSISMMNFIEQGKRIPGKMLRDRILARMGISGDIYEDYLSFDEYEQWVLRGKILNSILKKQYQEAENLLEQYRVYAKENKVQQQFCKTMEYMLLQMQRASLELQRSTLEEALGLTVLHIERGHLEKKLLSVEEINLLTEYVWLREYHGKPEMEYTWRKKQYQDILKYIDSSAWDMYCSVKVYPKVAYYLGETILHKENDINNLKLGIEIIESAIELLRNTGRCYYLQELAEVYEQLVLKYNSETDDVEKYIQKNRDISNWKKTFFEVYEEYGVQPYMEDFTYLYRENVCYCIGDVIRVRREMFGMRKEELCEGVCSVKTLNRIEANRVKPQIATVRGLFARLGLCAEYVRARVITSDAEVLMLADRLVRYQNNLRFEEWEQGVVELSYKLNMAIPQNRQFVEHAEQLLKYEKREISLAEFIEKVEHIIEHTIPLCKLMGRENIFLSIEEKTYVGNIGMRIERENLYMQLIEQLCDESKDGSRFPMSISMYEFLGTNLASYLGNYEMYDKSDELAEDIIRQSLDIRRILSLKSNMYNNLWNEQQRLLHKKSIKKKYEKTKILGQCISICDFTKQNNSKKFYESKMDVELL